MTHFKFSKPNFEMKCYHCILDEPDSESVHSVVRKAYDLNHKPDYLVFHWWGHIDVNKKVNAGALN